ncbi:MAG: efflux RND transporter permease subunit [Marinifilaceae bacterium]|jgi:Cu(I)/Ag(I) efflux system membrane protein CusA/SilA|nr:efflux RND transporter permease subunit [Marinifilaceae bacterium]
MVNKLIKYLIHNKLIAVIFLLFFLAWGVINSPFGWDTKVLPSYPVAVDAIPDIGENQQIVFTKWDGKSPQDIEDQISYPLTTSLLGIPGIKTIRSSSMFGFSSIYIIFEENVDFYWSRTRILEKLNSLPSGLLPTGVKPSLGPDATGLGQIFWYTLEGKDENGNTTGGWDLSELRSVQDYYVKYALSSAKGVSEVASIGGYVQEYQIDVDPDLIRQYGINLNQVVKAVRETNKEIGAQTIEINKVEYFVRGLGYIKSVSDIENAVVSSVNYTPIKVKDIAKVKLGPKARRGILDKEGAEVVGGVVVARYGSNPLEVINNVKEKIKDLSKGLPSKKLDNGKISKLEIVPFYDRTNLIHETLGTLEEALSLEIIITILVIIVMVMNMKASLLISGSLPVAVLMVFIAMKLFGVDANIVALSGIAIAIGTMVDVGIVLAENIIKHIERNKDKLLSINTIVYNASAEVSSAIITAVLTTIISFLPVFSMVGAEGKLFRPLAFTKSFALIAAIMVALFILPPIAAFVFKKRKVHNRIKEFMNYAIIALGIIGLFLGYYISIVIIIFGGLSVLLQLGKLDLKWYNRLSISIATITVIFILTRYWNPLGESNNLFKNLIFVAIICFGILGVFSLLKHYYNAILKWALNNRLLFLSIPLTLVICGFFILKNIGKEFMPSLNEGSFLLMPTTMTHAGVDANKKNLKFLDIAVSNIPEIETVVGKAGRVESALDPAPLSMYENVIIYKPEYMLENGKKYKYKVNDDGLFVLKSGDLVANPNITDKKSKINFYDVSSEDLIKDDGGELYRNWRPSIKSTNDIWDEIAEVTSLPGVTAAPKLQPIETRLVMLQTGMRAPMGLKIKGQNIKEIEDFGIKMESILKSVEGVKKEAVFADRLVAKPYLLIDIDRDKIAKYGLSIEKVQNDLSVAIGGKVIGRTIEGRERYGIRVRYPREKRSDPTDIKNIYISLPNGNSLPLSELAKIKYEVGPQVIKSEDSFLVSYVLFDKLNSYAEVNVVENAKKKIESAINSGELVVPKGINYEFSGTYQNQIRAEKTLSLVVPIALLSIFLLLYFQFKSVSTSLIVFTGIAVAFAGGFIMIWLYGQDWFMNFSFFGVNMRSLFQMHTINLSVAVWVGFIALFGIATDDGVLMATYLSQIFKKNNPKTKEEIRKNALAAGNKRIRACLMTTVTTILALLPVLTSSGKGSDIMIPMAIPCFGGMLIDITSYFIVPVLFSWKKEFEIKKIKNEDK